MLSIIIREYQPQDEDSWLRCRVLAFLHTAYFDNVLQKKEKYENPSIELVAIEDGQVVGLMDMEYETAAHTVCTAQVGLGGMIWHMAVHPDYQRRGIGENLLDAAKEVARERQLTYIEAWTRDDRWVQAWYEKMSFQQVSSYYHLYLEGEEISAHTNIQKPNSFYNVALFVHYTGEDISQFESLKRKHQCVCYTLNI